jgi:SapC
MAKSDGSNGTDARGAGKSALPLFYVRPEPVTAKRMAGKSLARQGTLAFARKTNAVPVNAIEFALVQRHYPIVFTTGDKPRPLAIVGLRSGENLFVGADGRWAERAYIPGYVRRYPFILMGEEKSEKFALCVDTASELIVDGNTNPFFADGKQTKLIEGASKICGMFHAEAGKTEQFCAALAEQKLLETKAIDVSAGAEKKLKLGPFQVIDAKKLAAMPDAVIVDWERKNWLPAVHAHLFSLNNWQDLAARLGPA